MESKYVEHSYKTVERNSNPLELRIGLHWHLWYEFNTISWCKKVFVTFIENCIRNDYVYLLNGKDEAIEMSR